MSSPECIEPVIQVLTDTCRTMAQSCSKGSSTPFWYSPTFGVLSGLFLMLAKSIYDAYEQRRRLLNALVLETTTARKAIKNVMANIPTREDTHAVRDRMADKAKPLTFDDLDKLPGGWVLFSPSFSYGDVITKLQKQEAEAVIEYLDAWHRLMEYERRYVAYYSKLLDATTCVGKLENSIQVRELASLTAGTIEAILNKLKELARVGYKLEQVASWGLRRKPFRGECKPVEFDITTLPYPKDWDPPAGQSATSV